MFSPHEKQFILSLARESIESFLRTGKKLIVSETPPHLPFVRGGKLPPSVCESRACFVTLTKDFELRGCIGHLEATQPVYQDIIDNAIAAATEDDRFNPVTLDELPMIDIEVSVLTKPVPLTFSSPEELVSKLRVGVDGVILKQGNHSATFLPQVWDELLDKKEFLAALCVKAGLPPGEWMSPKVEVETYQVEIVN